MSLGAPEAVAPEGAAGELGRPDAPKAIATEARASGPEAAADGQVLPRAPEVVAQETPPSALATNGRTPSLVQLRRHLESLRKRKGPPICSAHAYWPLKQRKYIGIDE